MASLNLAVIIGHLGRDPETRYMPDGNALTTLIVATTDVWTDKASGEKKEATEWHRVVFSGRLAEVAGEYLKKGGLVCVRGRIRTRKWTDKNDVERYTTEIRGDELKMVGGREDSAPPPSSDGEPAARQAPAQRAPTEQKKPAGKFDDMEDDIPF